MGTPEVAGIKSTPYQHQIDCFNVSKDRKSFAIFSDMGTGKCLMCLMTAAYLYLTGKIKRLLIVAPKGCYRTWVEDEVPKHLQENLPYKLAYWSSYSTKDDKKQLLALEAPGEALRILVVNVEACNTERAVDFMVDFMKKQATMLVVDESTVLKNPQAKRTKIMVNVGKFAEYRRICTGNPIPNGPLDLYMQTEFLQKNLLGYTNYFAFRNRFAVMQDQKFGQQSFKRVVGYRDLDALKALMRKFSFIIKKADCLDLPPKVYQVVDVGMGPRQTEAYNKMVQDAYIQLEGGNQVTAQMVITQLLRLHQIACGFLKPDYMDEVPFGEPNDRLETLLGLLDQAPGKVIIWANYRYNVKQIIAAISEKYGKDSVVSYFGDTGDDDRKYAKQAFQDPDSPVKYMVSNPDTGRFGNTWTQGTTVIYYSNSYNLESREQSEDRAHRIGQQGAIHIPGQDPSVLYIDIQVRGTVDERIIKVLKAKKKLTDEIVESNWRWLLGGKAA
jgi:SNF2 family DNA or RNA helicase